MLSQIHYPQHITSQELDSYLEHGWFRMGQSIFTTNFLSFKNQLYSAVWLRVLLQHYTDDSAFTKLKKQNAGFRIEIREAAMAEDKELLYAQYKQHISFNASASLHQLLYGKSILPTVYNTCEINLFDGEKLVAVGYFDIGKRSAAGISSFYDPSYKKYSLGKYLIYLKMEYCRQMGFEYFYPGYFVPGYKAFDYKLDMGRQSIEFLDVQTNQWLLLKCFKDTPLQKMKEKLSIIQHLLAASNVAFNLLRYEFFDANLIPELNGAEVFDSPLFLYGENNHEGLIGPLITFDIQSEMYQLLTCFSLWKSDVEATAHDVYASNLLKVQQILLTTDSVFELVSFLQTEFKTRLV